MYEKLFPGYQRYLQGLISYLYRLKILLPNFQPVDAKSGSHGTLQDAELKNVSRNVRSSGSEDENQIVSLVQQLIRLQF